MLCLICNGKIPPEGVEHVELIQTARFLNEPPVLKFKSRFFCGIPHFRTYMSTRQGRFDKNAVVHEVRTGA